MAPSILHCIIRAIGEHPDASATLLDSLHVLLIAGANPDRRDQDDLGVMVSAMIMPGSRRTPTHILRTMRAALKALMARTAPSTFYAGLDAEGLIKVWEVSAAVQAVQQS